MRRRAGRYDRQKDLVGFVVGDVHYAVPIASVREIIQPLPLVTLPQAPAGVLGVADHRGEVVPVLDLRRRFGLPSQPPGRRAKWVVVTLRGQSVGLFVDAVTDVYGASDNDDRPLPQLGPEQLLRGVASVVRFRDGLVFVLDVAAVAAPALEVDLEALRAPEHAP
ncbi:MAG: chemotaxis protein CheW [Myxococcota bacterium]